MPGGVGVEPGARHRSGPNPGEDAPAPGAPPSRGGGHRQHEQARRQRDQVGAENQAAEPGVPVECGEHKRRRQSEAGTPTAVQRDHHQEESHARQTSDDRHDNAHREDPGSRDPENNALDPDEEGFAGKHVGIDEFEPAAVEGVPGVHPLEGLIEPDARREAADAGVAHSSRPNQEGKHKDQQAKADGLAHGDKLLVSRTELQGESGGWRLEAGGFRL